MRHGLSLTIMLATLLASGVQTSAFGPYHKGLVLFDKGMYSSARSCFEAAEDPLSDAYAVLCAARISAPDYEELMRKYFETHPVSVIDPLLHCQHGLNLFDKGEYEAAAFELEAVDVSAVDASQLPELVFKKGYCSFVSGDYGRAADCFNEVVSMPRSSYTASAGYFLGTIAYNLNDFKEAESWFAGSASDPRFAELSAFYIVECRFMLKDYGFVVKEGVRLMETAPAERQSRLSRLISESYLVLGDKKSALAYYRKEQFSKESLTRSDYFHAGSVLYAVADYKGAIENFTLMTDRTDSLGQTANYQLGYSYIRTGNKVAALESFNEAAKFPYNADIREDAAFNYAKLAFDLNHDSNGFKAYLDTYSTKSKGELIYSYMALADLFNRDYAGAIEAYGNIEHLDDVQEANYIKANYLRACQLMEARSWSDAVPFLKASGFHYPRTDGFNQLTRYWLGQAYYHTERYDEALKLFTDLYNLSAFNGRGEGAMLPYDIAYCHFKQDNLSNAARWFDNYISSGAAFARKDALLKRADCDFLRRDYAAAAAAYGRVMDEFKDVNDIYPYFRQAQSYGLAGDKRRKLEVLSAVRNADKSAPMYSEALYELGRSYLDLSDYKSATESFNALRRDSSDSTYVARALIGLGMVARNNGKYDNALQHYKSVIEMMPGSEYAQDALLAIESIYQSKKQPELYLAYLEASKLNVNKTPEERAAMYFNTAEQVFLSENYANAAGLMETYLKNYPAGASRGEATFYLAESYKALGNPEKACSFYARVPSLLGEGPFVESSLLNSGNINYSLERYEEAYKAYSTLLTDARIEDNRTVARAGMMRSAYRAGRFEDAVSACGSVEGTESDYIKAKSLLALSRRDEAMQTFRKLAAEPDGAEGAEAAFLLIQDAFDRADYDAVERGVYDFAGKGASQSYWLARAYLVLGDSFAARGNKAQARATYESIRDGYRPAEGDDDMKDNVNVRIQRLQNDN